MIYHLQPPHPPPVKAPRRNLSAISIRVETAHHATLDEITKDAKTLSDRIGMNVDFEFNGREFTAFSGGECFEYRAKGGRD